MRVGTHFPFYQRSQLAFSSSARKPASFHKIRIVKYSESRDHPTSQQKSFIHTHLFSSTLCIVLHNSTAPYLQSQPPGWQFACKPAIKNKQKTPFCPRFVISSPHSAETFDAHSPFPFYIVPSAAHFCSFLRKQSAHLLAVSTETSHPHKTEHVS